MMRAMQRAASLALCSALVLGCGGGSTAAPPPPLPAPAPGLAVGEGALTTSLSRVDWLLGDWRYADGSGEEHWMAIGGVVYGVAFVGDRFEVMIVDDDDGQDDGPPEGKLRFIAMPGGAAPVEFAHDRSATSDAATAVFVNPQHDFPTSIVYARTGADRLQATLGGTGGGSTIPMVIADAVPSPDAEAMDRLFASETATDGIDGWMRHFAADAGAVKHDDTGASVRFEGHDAIRAAYGPILEIGALLWEPKWSRLAPGGNLAATVGSATLEKDGKVLYRGNYVTIWRRTDGGPWQVIFDTGRPENSQTRVASSR
jgi:hypothetical protein